MTRISRMQRHRAWTAVLLSLAGSISAAERVTVRPPSSAGLLVESGDVVDWNDERLQLRSGGRVRSIPASDVVDVQYLRSQAEQSGLEQFASGDIRGARDSYLKALETEGREWVRREILGELVRCESRLGNSLAATTHFVELVISDPHHRDWSLAPFGWESLASTPALQAAARHWLVHPAEGVRLVGAAILMSDAQGVAEAVAELKRLARLTDEYIGPLARVLLWDVEPAGASPSREELERRRRDIERMPESVRGGPWYRLARAHARRYEAEEAISAYLRVFIAHAEQDELAARSGLEAAVLLQQLNRTEEAETLLYEVISRFPESRVISEAQGRLQPPTAAEPPVTNPCHVGPVIAEQQGAMG